VRVLCSDAASLPLERNFDLGVSTKGCGANCGCNPIDMPPNVRPPGAAGENDEGNAARTQVLLVPDAPIRGEQYVEGCVVRSFQERTVAECVPALGLRGVDGVPVQRADQPFGRAVVKEDEHRSGRGPREGSQPRNPVRPSLARASRRTAR